MANYFWRNAMTHVVYARLACFFDSYHIEPMSTPVTKECFNYLVQGWISFINHHSSCEASGYSDTAYDQNIFYFQKETLIHQTMIQNQMYYHQHHRPLVSVVVMLVIVFG